MNTHHQAAKAAPVVSFGSANFDAARIVPPKPVKAGNTRSSFATVSSLREVERMAHRTLRTGILPKRAH